MCETKRGQRPSQSLSSSPDSRKECSFRKFLGKWSKDDGNVVFMVMEIEGQVFVRLDGCVNTVEAKMSNCEEFCFSWNDFDGKNWGPARFSWLDENTILENQHNIFRKQGIQRFTDSTAVTTTQCQNYHLLPPSQPQTPFTSSLSERDIKDFKANGYLIIRNAASLKMVSRCRRSILADIGSQGLPPNYLQQYKSTSFCPALRSNHETSGPLREIFRQSYLPGILLDLVGPSQDGASHTPQIAMIWPQPEALNEKREVNKHAHIDGIASPTNHLVPGQIHGFSVLCGISLSNQDEDFSGSLVVYPKSHVLINEVLKTQWSKQEELDVPESLRKLGPGQWSWQDGNAIPNNILDNIEPVQVLLSKGDAIIAHHQLCHSVSQNYSDDIRIQLYYRLKHLEYDRVESLLDLWKDFDSITAGLNV